MLNNQFATLGLLALLLMFDTRETDPFALECSPAQADSAALDCVYVFTARLVEPFSHSIHPTQSLFQQCGEGSGTGSQRRDLCADCTGST